MLKNLFKKKENEFDKIIKSIYDGYVDIKMYDTSSGNKKLVYHDSGDNAVTDWMRDSIAMLIGGYVNGSDAEYTSNMFKAAAVNGEQYGQNVSTETAAADVSDDIKLEISKGKNPIYPTKILFGTGKEYTSWDDLKKENSVDNKSWYDEQIENYGNGAEDTAKDTFDNLIKDHPEYYSATIGEQGIYNGSTSLKPSVFVQDPNTTANASDKVINLATRYGVVGGVRTKYVKESNSNAYDNNLLNPTTSESGRLLKPNQRGVGYPCFLYFKRHDKSENNDKDIINGQTSDVFVNGDSNSNIKNRITFTIKMPSQSSDEYYPYNGILLKQVGLFNDCVINDKMPYGTLQAVKNITPLTKFASGEINITWTLTV